MNTVLNLLSKEQLQQVVLKKSCECVYREMDVLFKHKNFYNFDYGDFTQVIVKNKMSLYYKIINYCIKNNIIVSIISSWASEYLPIHAVDFRDTKKFIVKSFKLDEYDIKCSGESWFEYIKRINPTQIFIHDITVMDNVTVGKYIDGYNDSYIRMYGMSEFSTQGLEARRKIQESKKDVFTQKLKTVVNADTIKQNELIDNIEKLIKEYKYV